MLLQMFWRNVLPQSLDMSTHGTLKVKAITSFETMATLGKVNSVTIKKATIHSKITVR